MGDNGDRVGDTCWACCRLASVLRDRGLTTAGRCCGEELGVFIPWPAPPTPRCARLPVLLELVRAGNGGSSGSSGVGSGEGKWMLVRSGREPPVLWVAGIRAVVFSWSADGKMLMPGTSQDLGLEPA